MREKGYMRQQDQKTRKASIPLDQKLIDLKGAMALPITSLERKGRSMENSPELPEIGVFPNGRPRRNNINSTTLPPVTHAIDLDSGINVRSQIYGISLDPKSD